MLLSAEQAAPDCQVCTAQNLTQEEEWQLCMSEAVHVGIIADSSRSSLSNAAFTARVRELPISCGCTLALAPVAAIVKGYRRRKNESMREVLFKQAQQGPGGEWRGGGGPARLQEPAVALVVVHQSCQVPRPLKVVIRLRPGNTSAAITMPCATISCLCPALRESHT